MAKRTKKEPVDESSLLDSFNEDIRVRASKKGAGGADSLEESYNIYGFELKDSLPLQYLLGVNVLALGRCLLLVGPPAGGKSQFVFLLSKLFGENGGLANIYETEGKVSKEQVYGVIQDADIVAKRMNFKFCRTQEDTQKAISSNTDIYETKCLQSDYWPPLMSALDSLSGNTSEKQSAAIEKEGSAAMTTAGMHKAKSWKDYLQSYVPNHVSIMPYTFVVVNHEGSVINEGGGGGFGGPQKNTGAGGVFKDYQSTWTLRLSTAATVIEKVGTDTEYGRHSVTKYFAKNIKNALGIKSRNIAYEVIAYRDENGQRVLKYDWDSALVDLLKDTSLKMAAGSVEQIIDIKGEGQRWTCPMVGVPHTAEAAITKSAMGKLLHNTPDVYKLIQSKLLDVSIYPTWDDPATRAMAIGEIKAKLADRGKKVAKQRRKE